MSNSSSPTSSPVPENSKNDRTERWLMTPTRQSSKTRTRDVPCWYFLYGECKFGSRCVNDHPALHANSPSFAVEPTAKRLEERHNSTGTTWSVGPTQAPICGFLVASRPAVGRASASKWSHTKSFQAQNVWQDKCTGQEKQSLSWSNIHMPDMCLGNQQQALLSDGPVETDDMDDLESVLIWIGRDMCALLQDSIF